MPRYECVEDGASKFWEIEREGLSFTVRYGKIGSDGQTSTKEFSSEAQTLKEYDKIVASKVKKGYELVSDEDEDGDEDEEGGAVEIPPFQANPDLERAILADPAVDANWLVYADWLQSRDDPRGALMAAQAKGNNAKKSKTLLSEHSAAFLGRFASGRDLEKYAQIEWHMGFWRKVKTLCDYDSATEIPDDLDGLAGVLDQLLSHPSARLLRTLALGLTEGVDDGCPSWQASIDILAKMPRPSVRSLIIGDFEQEESEISWAEIGSLASLWAALPELRDLTVRGGSIELGSIAAPKLASLRLWSGGLLKEPIEQIIRASFPELTHLELWFGAGDYGGECASADVAPLLVSEGLPKLTSLGLMNAEFANELPAMLAGSPLLPRLQVLDLSMGTLSDAGGQALLDNAAAFAHLERLVLDRNYLPKALVTKLKKALPRAQIKDQQQGGEGDRYVSVGE